MLLWQNLTGWDREEPATRGLIDIEKQGHELLKQSFQTALYEQNATIRFNSTYMELVDKFYYTRGTWIFLMYLFILTCLSVGLGTSIFIVLNMPENITIGTIFSAIFIILLSVFLLGGVAYAVFRGIYKVDFSLILTSQLY